MEHDPRNIICQPRRLLHPKQVWIQTLGFLSEQTLIWCYGHLTLSEDQIPNLTPEPQSARETEKRSCYEGDSLWATQYSCWKGEKVDYAILRRKKTLLPLLFSYTTSESVCLWIVQDKPWNSNSNTLITENSTLYFRRTKASLPLTSLIKWNMIF